MEAVELKVEIVGIHSERRLWKCLSKLRGVEKVEVELSKKKVVVRGEAEQSRIVKALRRNGFRSEPWCSKSEILLTAYVATKASGRCHSLDSSLAQIINRLKNLDPSIVLKDPPEL